MRNEIHCSTLAADVVIRNKAIEVVRNKDAPCNRSATDESAVMIKDLKEKRMSRMKNENANDYHFREELNRSINEFRRESCNHCNL